MSISNNVRESYSTSGISRRAFVGGAAAASFAILAPRTALCADANSRVKAGIIGLGGRGRMIASMVHSHGGFEITAVADYFQELSEGAGAQFGVPGEHCFSGLSGYKGLIDSGVEAVFLETPPYCFPEHAAAAVEAGHHVYMAKPVACDVPGCLRIAQAGAQATTKKQVFMVDFQTRTDPLNIEVVQGVRDNTLGSLALLSSLYTDEGFADPPKTDTIENRLRQLIWVNDDALGGGYLVNAGIHAIDVALWMSDAIPINAMGLSRRMRSAPNGDSHDVYSITYEFNDGLLLNHRGEHLHNQHGFNCGCTAFCRDGFGEAAYKGEAFLQDASGKRVSGQIENLYERGPQVNIAAFHDQILAGLCENATVSPSVNATLATLLGREACLKGARLSWDAMIKESRRLEPDLSGLKV